MFLGGDSTLSTVLLAGISYAHWDICFLAAMLPFLTDQIIGATSDELSAVVQWYVWAKILGLSVSE